MRKTLNILYNLLGASIDTQTETIKYNSSDHKVVQANMALKVAYHNVSIEERIYGMDIPNFNF